MKKFKLLQETDKIKEYLNVKYHNLLDDNIFKIKTNFNIQNCIQCKFPSDNIECLSNYYKTIPYYKSILNDAKKVKLPYHSKKMDTNIDFILLEYIKYTKNIVPILLWPTVASKEFLKNKKSKKFINFLQDNGKIIISKYFQLTKKQAESFLFQLYSSHSYFKIYENLLHSLKMKKFNKDELNDLIVIFWIPKVDNKIYFADNNNLHKRKLRDILFKDFKNNLYTNYSNNDLKLKDLLHIVDSELETIELAQMIFNNNTLELMKYQRMDILIGKYRKFTKSIIILNLFKKLIYTKFQLIDINRILAFSSIVLFSLGLRNFNDIDAFFYHYPKYITSETPKLKDIVDEFVSETLGGNSRQIIEFIVKGYGDWTMNEFKDYPHKWLEKTLPEMYGANTFENVVFHPKYHFYFLGIKCVTYEGDFARRMSRNRPASIADLIAVNRMTHFKINIPKLPKKIWVSHKEVIIDDQEKINIVHRIKKYLQHRYSIFMDINEIMKLVN